MKKITPAPVNITQSAYKKQQARSKFKVKFATISSDFCAGYQKMVKKRLFKRQVETLN